MMDRLEEKCKKMIAMREYKKCEKEICKAMADAPHSAIPHNLMGILMETQRNHIMAMKHFRAAYALDPTYIPARYNMELFVDLDAKAELAYTQEDCPLIKR